MDEYLGVIKLFAGQYVPIGYLECKGQLLDVRLHDTLYKHIIGNTYGGVENVNFNLPKMDPPCEGTRYIICVKGLFPVSNDRD